MADWIFLLTERLGHFGVFLLMLIENVFPPIPSELVMPLAGYRAAQGRLDPVGVVLAGSLGSVAGAVFWYGLARWYGRERLERWTERHGRWVTLSRRDVVRSCRWFDRHGGKAVLFGRLVPAVRTLISLPAGIAAMPLRRFLLFTTLGSLAWSALLTGAGYLLEDRHEVVAAYLDPVSSGVIVLLALLYLWRLATWNRGGG